MQDRLQKGNIDLDELVNSLLKEKTNTAERQMMTEEQRNSSQTLPPEEIVEQTAVEGESPLPVVSERQEAFAEPLSASEPVIEEEEERTIAVEQLPPQPKRKFFGWFKREREPEDVLDEEWADWDLKPIGHYHKNVAEDTPVAAAAQPPVQTVADEPLTQAPIEDIASGREMPPQEREADEPSVEPDEPGIEPATVIMPAIRTTVEDVTRVVDVRADAPVIAASTDEKTEEAAKQLPDQLSLEELVRVEDVEDAQPPESEENAAERLQRTRQEKIKEFVLSGDEEEDNEPEEEAIEETQEDEPEIEDFTGYETTKAVRLELQYRWRTALIGLLLSAGLEIILLLLTLITLSLGQSPITAIGYLTAHVFCLILMAALNYSSVSRGLSGLFMLKANNSTASATALVAALLGTLLHFLNLDAPLPVFAPLAGLLTLFNAAAQCVKLVRIRENFSFVAYPGTKYSAALVEDEKTAMEIGRRVSMEEPADVAYFRRTSFLSTYLGNAYDEDDGDRHAKLGAPIASVLSLLLSGVMLSFGALDGFWEWLSAFVFMLCLSAFTTALAMQLPMRSVCRRMLSKGGFLVGWNAVDAFGRPDALAVDVADLYPDESMLLHGIKTFSGMHIDDAILDAASLSIRAGGPLSMIFRRIIQNKEELLHEVDSLVYEQGMGLAGWVDGRRVLVGNRRLLQNHGVDVPSSDYEARYAKDGRRLVYLSTAGELSAMFVVSYLPDESIGAALRRLCRARVTLLVRSNDSNISAEDLCRDFELDEYYVDVLPAVACRMYDQLVAEETKETSAIMASNGHILGTATVLAACRTLRTKGRIVLAVQIFGTIVGLLCGFLWAREGISTYFASAFALMLISAVVSWIAPLFKRS